jgi:hypothetical protein
MQNHKSKSNLIICLQQHRSILVFVLNGWTFGWGLKNPGFCLCFKKYIPKKSSILRLQIFFTNKLVQLAALMWWKIW